MRKVRGEGKEVIEVLESFNGDLYFITEDQDGAIFCFARLYSMPECAEWGYNYKQSLYEAYGKLHLWPVQKKNWGNINSYEKGLLVEVE